MGKDNRNKGILGGLKAAFGFLVAFMILRYSIFLSVFFAAIAGVAVSLLLSWWESKEPPKAKFNPFGFKRTNWRRHYPNIKDIPNHASRRGFLNKQKSPEKNPEE